MKGGIYEKLVWLICDNNNIVLIEVRSKHEKSLCRIFTHKFGLNYNFEKNPCFDALQYYKCGNCNKTSSDGEMIWNSDLRYREYALCPNCNAKYCLGIDVDFETWIAANCVSIGGQRKKGEYENFRRKTKGDLTWSTEQLKTEMNQYLSCRKILVKNRMNDETAFTDIQIRNK